MKRNWALQTLTKTSLKAHLYPELHIINQLLDGYSKTGTLSFGEENAWHSDIRDTLSDMIKDVDEYFRCLAFQKLASNR